MGINLSLMGIGCSWGVVSGIHGVVCEIRGWGNQTKHGVVVERCGSAYAGAEYVKICPVFVGHHDDNIIYFMLQRAVYIG